MAVFRVAAACVAFVLMPPVLSAKAYGAARTDQIRIEYITPKKEEYQTIYQTMNATRSLEKLRQFFSPLKLPRKLMIRIRECDGDKNAFYEDYTVTVCYEYLKYILDKAPNGTTPGGITRKDVLVGAAVDVFLHEIGHAVFDILDIPIFGREEDAADFFSAYIILQAEPAIAFRLIRGVAYLYAREVQDAEEKLQDELTISLPAGQQEEAKNKVQKRGPMIKSLAIRSYADSHGLPVQRYFNLLCIAYGSNPKIFANALTVGRLTKQRAEGCNEEFEQVKSAMERLIGPSIDKKLQRKLRTKIRWVL